MAPLLEVALEGSAAPVLCPSTDLTCKLLQAQESSYPYDTTQPHTKADTKAEQAIHLILPAAQSEHILYMQRVMKIERRT